MKLIVRFLYKDQVIFSATAKLIKTCKTAKFILLSFCYKV